MSEGLQTTGGSAEMPASNDPRDGNTANIIYILYLVGLVVGITSVVGVVMAYLNRVEAAEWVRTHYRWQIRTFWIGLLYSLMGLALATVVIGFFILLFTAVWFIVRVVKGMQRLGQGEPVPNVESWMFG